MAYDPSDLRDLRSDDHYSSDSGGSDDTDTSSGSDSSTADPDSLEQIRSDDNYSTGPDPDPDPAPDPDPDFDPGSPSDIGGGSSGGSSSGSTTPDPDALRELRSDDNYSVDRTETRDSDYGLEQEAAEAPAYDGPETRIDDDSGGGIRDRVGDGIRDVTDIEVGLSDDFTSTEDSGGTRNVADTAIRTATADQVDISDVDAGLRDVTDGRVGISDDFTTTDESRVDVDTDVTDDLTRGGFLSETPEGDSGLLPGEVAGVDISEERFQGAAEWGDEQKAEFDKGPDFLGSPRAESALQGAAGVGVDILNVPQHVQTVETGAEVAQNLPGAVDEHGAGRVAGTATGVGVAVGGAMADDARDDPVEFGAGAVFGYATGAAAGKAAGQAGRVTRDRIRTAGGTRIDPEGLAEGDVIRHVETDGAEGKLFPDADDPDLYQRDPAEAVRRQANEYTPEEVDRLFEEQGVGDGTTLTKAVHTEPDGPGTGRSDAGFTSAPDDLDGDFDYETPGSFFGPELSPNFLRVDGGDTSFSPVPGLPDFGNQPTGVLARTDVENPDADDLQAFNQEIMDNVGDTTAYTKPADEVNVGEIEAVVPPGAEFAPVRSGGLFTDVARRAGVGSDFYTEVGGRRVPLRTVAPEGRTPDADADADAGTGGLFGDRDGGSGESLDYYVESPDQPVDRPLPVGVPGGSASTGEADTATSSGPESAPEPEYGYDGVDTDYDRPPADPEPTSDPGRSSDRDSPTSSRPESEPSSGVFGGSPSGGSPPSERDESVPPSSGPPSVPPSSGLPGASSISGPPSGGPPSDGGERGPPPTSPPPSSPGSSGPPSDPPWNPPADPPARPPSGDEPTDDELDWTEPEPVDPETPLYTNPIASGTDMLVGGGFGEPVDDGGAEDGADSMENGGGLFY